MSRFKTQSIYLGFNDDDVMFFQHQDKNTKVITGIEITDRKEQQQLRNELYNIGLRNFPDLEPYWHTRRVWKNFHDSEIKKVFARFTTGVWHMNSGSKGRLIFRAIKKILAREINKRKI